MENKNILITTYPFGCVTDEPLKILKSEGYIINSKAIDLKRKLTREELLQEIVNADGIIAGTEKYDREVLDRAEKLELISRVGIGLDSIDFTGIKKRGIEVCYTPDAPSRSVAELTVGLIVSLVRNVTGADRELRKGKWLRFIGPEIEGCVIGIIGLGRIGKKVAELLKPFNVEIMVNDLVYDEEFVSENGLIKSMKEDIYNRADIISLHIPLTDKTYHLINSQALEQFKDKSIDSAIAMMIKGAKPGYNDVSAIAGATLSSKFIETIINEKSKPYVEAIRRLDID